MNYLARLLLVLSFLPGAALAASEAVQASMDASAKYQALLKEYAAAGVDPSVQRVSPLLAQLIDQDVLVAARTAEDPLKSLMEACGAANAVNVSLALFGIENIGLKTKDPVEAATHVRALAERNTLKFQDQILPLTNFLTSCFAVQIPYMASFVQNLPGDQLTPIRLAGLTQFRGGMEAFLSQSLASVAEPRFNEKLRSELLETLALRAAVYAESLPKDRRDTIRRVGELVLTSVPVQFRLNVRRVIETMNTDKCNALCTM